MDTNDAWTRIYMGKLQHILLGGIILKKMLSTLVSAAILFTLVGCGGENVSANILYEKGVELTIKMDMLAENDDYINMISVAPELNATIKQIALNDYSQPSMVFEISGLEDAIIALLAQNGTSLPKEIEKIVKNRFVSALPSQINAQNGATMLAASSCVAISESFLYKDMAESKTYLYLYDGAYGSLVSFMPNDENIIVASANIFKSENLKTMSSGEDVEKFLSETMNIDSITVSQVLVNK